MPRRLTFWTFVAWKLRSPGSHRLACVGEVLALAAIINSAKDVLEDDDIEPDFSAFEQGVFEDKDFELLFASKLDGVEDTEVGPMLDIANRHFEDWFKPFRDASPVHPYVVPDQNQRVL